MKIEYTRVMKKITTAVLVTAITLTARSFSLGSGSSSVTCPPATYTAFCNGGNGPEVVTCNSQGSTPSNNKGTFADVGTPCSKGMIPYTCHPGGGQQTNCEVGNLVEDGHHE